MTARIIDGKKIASKIHDEVKVGVRDFESKYGSLPGLAVVLVGDDPASHSYVKGKEAACAKVGIMTETIRRKASITQTELLETLGRLNSDPKFSGILVQLPLPKHLDEDAVIAALDPAKDVDGLHPVNAGLLMLGQPRFAPATPLGVQRMLLEENVNLNGAKVVIVGRSKLVGMPLMALLLQKGPGANATVTVCHTGTKDIGNETRQADVLIAAAGFPGAVTADMLKSGAIVIDVGVSRVEDSTKKRGYSLVGDVEFSGASEVASAITPVPGGVGPMTISMLLVNVLRAANLAAATAECSRRSSNLR